MEQWKQRGKLDWIKIKSMSINFPFLKAYRTIYKSVQNWLHEISYESSYQPNNITEVHPRVVRINKRIERFTQMRANKQLSSISTQVTNYGIGRVQFIVAVICTFPPQEVYVRPTLTRVVTTLTPGSWSLETPWPQWWAGCLSSWWGEQQPFTLAQTWSGCGPPGEILLHLKRSLNSVMLCQGCGRFLVQSAVWWLSG